MITSKNFQYFLACCSLLVSLSFFVTQAHALEVIARSGSTDDIQAAADQVEAAGGGTVYIPAGKYTFTGEVKSSDGINFIGKGQEGTILSGGKIDIDTRYYGKLDKPFRISDISFVNGGSLRIDSCHDFRVDHVTVEADGGTAVSIVRSHRGVIDHCKVTQSGEYYGIYIIGDDVTWEEDISKLLGSAEAIFIEDCTFDKIGHCVDGTAGGHYVFRYNVLTNSYSAAVDAHGPGYGADLGTRAVEIYNNLIDKTNLGGIGIRGGGGVIFNNRLQEKHIDLVLEGDSEGPYPVPMQIHDLWIWGNTFEGVPEEEQIHVTSWSGQEELAKECIQENRDYFLRAPTQELDGFTYTPYTYPHPRVEGIDQYNPIDEGREEVRNRPNPFRAGKEVTLIEYNLNQFSNVTITIYDPLGQEVWRKSYEAGENGGRKLNSVPWDGRNLSGKVVANGGYICRIWVEKENKYMVRKIAVAK